MKNFTHTAVDTNTICARELELQKEYSVQSTVQKEYKCSLPDKSKIQKSQ